MALAEVNTSNKWLGSVAGNDFKHGIDIDRYKTFSSQLLNGEKPTMEESMLNNIWTTMSKAFSGMASFSKDLIMDIITGVLDTLLGIGGSLMDMFNIKNALSTVCGNFDAGLFNRYGGDSGAINGLGLMGLLSALLCMGVNLVLSAVKGIASVVGVTISGLVSVVSNTLDALVISPLKSVTGGIANSSFAAPVREFISTDFNIGGMLDEITGDSDLLSAFKGTDVSKRLLNGYSGDNFSSYADALIPNWNVSDLSNTTNGSLAFLNNSKSSVVDSIAGITEFKPKDFMMML